MVRLDKAVALITGGAKGFGKKFAQNLMSRGAKVVVADVDVKAGMEFQQEVINELGEKRFKFIKCNVADSKELNDRFEEAKDHFGQLDIVCNNAGIMTTDPLRARQQIDINLGAVVEGTYKGVELMSKQNGGNGGVVVNVASAAGIYLMKGAAVYTGTKHGVVHFSRSFKLLQHNSVDGVRVNCICPFFCKTSMLIEGEKSNPEMRDLVEKFGLVNIEDVCKGFMLCVENEDINGAAIAITPPDKIQELKFLTPVPKME